MTLWFRPLSITNASIFCLWLGEMVMLWLWVIPDDKTSMALHEIISSATPIRSYLQHRVPFSSEDPRRKTREKILSAQHVCPLGRVGAWSILSCRGKSLFKYGDRRLSFHWINSGKEVGRQSNVTIEYRVRTCLLLLLMLLLLLSFSCPYLIFSVRLNLTRSANLSRLSSASTFC